MERKGADDRTAEGDAAAGSHADAPSSSSNGVIPVIKIKIPKRAGVEEAAAVEEVVVKSHCCKECNKSFSSGKALGGHMSSAHVQANKDYSSALKKLSSRKRPSSASAAEEYGCMLCDKSFHTKKSLFGHMRCHPEREWRGMEPPPEIKIPSLSAEASSEEGGGGGGNGNGNRPDVEDQIDSGLGFNLKGWPVSNKRGRGPAGAGVVNPVIRAPDQERERESFVAGLQLIKMLKGDTGERPSRPRPEPDFKNHGKGKEKAQENQDSGSPMSPAVDPNDELFQTAIQVLVSVKRDKLDTQKRAEAETVSPEKYKCNECGRHFPTHQALGGHRSSHNKFSITVINTDSRSPTTPPTITKKKRNYSKKAEKSAESERDASSSSSSFAFAFDLNTAPPPEEEDMEEDSSD